MRPNLRRVLVVVLFSAIAGAGSLAWAGHGGGGGGGGGGHGHGGGMSFSGGHGSASFNHFSGHSGFNNWSGGWGGTHFYSGYRNFGWPYRYYRPYAYSFFGYPYFYGYYNYPGDYYGYPTYYYSYPSDYYANADSGYYGDARPPYYGDAPPQQYVVGRPVLDVARLEVRLPDPQATIWVQGKEITSSGIRRQFKSPQLDPSQQYTYNVKAQWNDNGKVVIDERQVNVQANALAVVDFTQPNQADPNAHRPAPADLPPPDPRPTG